MTGGIRNPDKVIFPDAGLTKRDLVEHYERVAPLMLPHVAERPLTLHRFPDGIGTKGFMQKNASAHFPDFIGRIEAPKRDGVTRYPVVTDATGLRYLADQGTVTFHIWTSRRPRLDHPDRIVFDLDPAAGDTAGAEFGARAVREFLAVHGLASVPMTTGSNGYHVVAPVEPEVPMDDVSEFARTAAVLIAERHPDRLTHEFRRAKRRGRVFVDWLRNRYGQTGVAPWSLRARPSATVAVPIGWEEVDGAPPNRWTLQTVAERLDMPDPLTSLAATPGDLQPAVGAVAAAVADLDLPPFDRFRS